MKWKNAGAVGAVALCLALALCSGCTLLTPASVEPTKYVLDKIPLDLGGERTLAATLLILAPETGPVYATRKMAYATQAHQVAYFSQNEWAATPSQMVLPLLVETLRRTRFFDEVESPPRSARFTFTLRTEILELKHDFTSEPAMLQLAMRISLTRNATNQVIATRDLSVREPMRERTPYAGVVAANHAVEKLLRDAAGFVVEKAQ